MAFLNIDAPGKAIDRRGVRAIQKAHGSAGRLAAAQARRDRKAARRAAPSAILFYPWPVGGVCSTDRDGAYAQGPNGEGRYQVVVKGEPKGEPAAYCAAVSKWVGLELRVESSAPLEIVAVSKGLATDYVFLSIILAPASES